MQDDRNYTDDGVGESHFPALPAVDVPTITDWKIDRSGAGIRIRGRTAGGSIGNTAATHVACSGAGLIYAFRDADCIARLAVP